MAKQSLGDEPTSDFIQGLADAAYIFALSHMGSRWNIAFLNPQGKWEHANAQKLALMKQNNERPYNEEPIPELEGAKFYFAHPRGPMNGDMGPAWIAASYEAGVDKQWKPASPEELQAFAMRMGGGMPPQGTGGY